MFAALLSNIASLADAAPASPAAQPAAGSFTDGLLRGPVPLIMMIYAVFWFMWLGPKRKQAKQLEEWVKSIKKGDEVVTTGGLIGKITGLTDQTVTLEVQEKVRLKVVRSAIAGKAPSATAQSSTAAPAAETNPATK